jgi:tetratricopeptide (TPR) repeat protein
VKGTNRISVFVAASIMAAVAVALAFPIVARLSSHASSAHEMTVEQAIGRLFEADQLAAAGDAARAYNIYSEILKYHPFLENALIGRARAAYQLGRYDECIENLDRVESKETDGTNQALVQLRRDCESKLNQP